MIVAMSAVVVSADVVAHACPEYLMEQQLDYLWHFVAWCYS